MKIERPIRPMGPLSEKDAERLLDELFDQQVKDLKQIGQWFDDEISRKTSERDRHLVAIEAEGRITANLMTTNIGLTNIINSIGQITASILGKLNKWLSQLWTLILKLISALQAHLSNLAEWTVQFTYSVSPSLSIGLKFTPPTAAPAKP